MDNRYKAVFIDLDGTLLRPDHSISEATRNTIQKLIAENILVILVSARPFHGITPYSSFLGTQSFPIISLNGALIKSDNNTIFESCIDVDTVALLRQANEYHATLIYYSGNEWFAETMNAAIIKEQKITDIKVVVAPFEELRQNWKLHNTGMNKVMAIGDKTLIPALESKLISVFQKQMNIYTSKPEYLEIMREDASKKHGVEFILKKYAIRREEIIAIGDNFNDLEMIMYAGTGVAMGNAPDAIKAAADFVTDTNVNDGVRKAIEKFIGL